MKQNIHFEVSIITRGKGKSVVASAAYIAGEKIKNEWDGITHDYTRKKYFIRRYYYQRTYQKNLKKENTYGTK